MKTTRGTFGITASVCILFCAALCAAGPLSDPPQTREIKMTARRYEFSPKTITVSKGERVKLVVTSEDVDHGLAIKEFNVDQEIKAKQTKVIEFAPDKEGRFEFTCSVFCGDGHPEMVGELIVTGSPAQPDSTKMKVTFDTPGVVIVESAGERLRIDTTTRTIERISEPATAQKQTKRPAEPVPTRERESSKAYAVSYTHLTLPTIYSV